MNLSEWQQEIRIDIRQRRRQLTQDQQQSATLNAGKRITEHQKIQKALNIAVFFSFDGELNTQPIIHQLWQQQKKVYLPVLHPFNTGYLLFLRYEPCTTLVPNRFNILEPQLDSRRLLPTQKLEVILTPLVAFNSLGQRLGMGGEFYDRLLKHWPIRGPYPIGLAHDCQYVEQLPIANWDISLPEIITPSKLWRTTSYLQAFSDV